MSRLFSVGKAPLATGEEVGQQSSWLCSAGSVIGRDGTAGVVAHRGRTVSWAIEAGAETEGADANLGVVRKTLVGDAAHGADDRAGRQDRTYGGNARRAKHGRREEFERGGSALEPKQRLRRRKAARHRIKPCPGGSRNHVRIG